jgi:hypothetical protein
VNVKGKPEMEELTFDEALKWATSGLTAERFASEVLAGEYDHEPSRLCPGVPRRAVWAACRLASQGQHGMIQRGTDFALVAAMGIFEFQPDIEQA